MLCVAARSARSVICHVRGQARQAVGGAVAAAATADAADAAAAAAAAAAST